MACALSLKEEFLTCAICTEYYTDPCTLGCQHSFCRKCITDFLKTRPDAVQSRTIPCAFCRQDTRVPNPSRPVEEWAGQFKPSLILKGLMDRLQSGHIHREGQDICFLCEEVGETTPAKSWCCDCEVTLCSRCAKMHLKAPSSKNHDLLDLSGGEMVKKRRKVKCSEHEGEQVKYMCKDCNKSVCQTCCTIKHRACVHVVTIESMIPEIKSTLNEEKCKLEKRVQNTMAYVKQEESKLQLLKDKVKTTGLNMKSEIESAIFLLRKRETELLKELGDLTDKYTSQHKAIIKSGHIMTQMYQQHFEFIDQVLQSQSEVEMYEIYQVCQSGAVMSVEDTESDKKNIPAVEDVTYKPNMGPLKKAISDMGGVVIDMGEVTPMLSTGYQPPDRAVTEFRLVSYHTINIKHSGDRSKPDLVDVTVLTVNGVITIVAADYNNKMLKSFYSENPKLISVVLLSGKPSRLARITENRVAVTLSDSHIALVDVRPELVLVMILKTKRLYTALTSLSDTTLAAGRSSTPIIDLIDLRGNLIKTLTPYSTGLSFVKHPQFMCTTHEGNILVTNFSSQSVYCLTPKGDVVFTYKPTSKSKPRGITVTDTGDILLSMHNPYSIIHLTSSGTFIKTLLTSADDTDEPWGACFHGRDTLYVCSRRRGDKCVEVFRFKQNHCCSV